MAYTDDGNGNLTLDGVEFSDDGSGNLTVHVKSYSYSSGALTLTLGGEGGGEGGGDSGGEEPLSGVLARDEVTLATSATYKKVTEVESKISQTAREISLEVSQQVMEESLGEYYTKEQTDAKITTTAGQIALEVTDREMENRLGDYYTIAQTNAAINVSLEGITSTVDEKIANATGGFDQRITDIVQTTEGITARVEAVEDTAHGNSERISEVVQTTDSVITSFKETTETAIEGLEGDLDKEIKNRETLIRQSAEGIEIGKSDSALTMRLSNAELGFYDGEEKVSYINDKRMYITEAEIMSSLRFGSFTFSERANGNMGLTWGGGN